MNVRTVLVPALAAVLLAGTAGAGAATPTLDGKRVRTLAATYHPAAQDHDSELVTDSAPAPVGTPGDRVTCGAARCGRLVFRYLPATGVKGGLMFRTSWTNPATDIDLYVAEIDRHGDASAVAQCALFGGTSESVYVPAGTLRPGRTYAIVNDWFRVAPGETVKTAVTFPSADKTATTVPKQADPLGVNCQF